jgi:hypothetical protein
LYPTIFTSAQPFQSAFNLNATGEQMRNSGSAGGAKQGSSGGGILVDRQVLAQAHHLMRPLMLRR